LHKIEAQRRRKKKLFELKPFIIIGIFLILQKVENENLGGENK
jgi:hypothetical protein